ncbi:MAG: cytochrome c-type biogenesis protein CcmH [Candidatus Methanoperedens sp.]|nr:cytochrome c-type biogenesis protein CcmH [Candidatus Methanoperedens sp.]
MRGSYFNNISPIWNIGKLHIVLLFIFLISGIDNVLADDEMTSGLICPCECVMILSTCDCTTAIQVKKEITLMRRHGFSEKQMFSALQVEYGEDILAHPKKSNSNLFWMAAAALIILFVFLGYILSRKMKTELMPDIKKYEESFEDEYRKFVSEMEEK